MSSRLRYRKLHSVRLLLLIAVLLLAALFVTMLKFWNATNITDSASNVNYGDVQKNDEVVEKDEKEQQQEGRRQSSSLTEKQMDEESLRLKNLVEQPCKEFQINFKNIKKAYCIEKPMLEEIISEMKLFIIIPSEREDFDIRQTIRETYLKDKVKGTVAFFFVSDPPAGESLTIQEELRDEQRNYTDLVFVHGFEDTYNNLNLKILAAFQCQRAFFPLVDWILKIDSDMLVYLPRLDHWIEHKFRKELEKNKATIFGRARVRDPNNKYYVPDSDYPDRIWPDFMLGQNYLASRWAISEILAHTNEVNAIRIEDALFTGILAKRAGISLSNQKSILRRSHSPIYQGEELECEDGIPLVATTSTFRYKDGMLKWYTDDRRIPEMRLFYDQLKMAKCK